MKRLYAVLLFAFIFVTMAARAEIVFNIGGTGDDHGTGIAVDSKGNYVAVGYFRGAVDFDPTELINEKTALANPSDPEASDIYVAKYDTKGKLTWVFTIGSSGPNRPSSVYIDDQDYIYLTGYFSGKANFNPSTGTTILDAGQGRNVFLAKYTPDAKLEWAIGYGDNETAPYAQNDTRYDEGFDVAVDPGGRVYVTGAFGGKIDLDPSDGEDAEDTYTSKTGADNKPSRDAFVACYDTSGSFIWGFAIGGPGTDEGHAIKTGFDGSVYVAGMFSNTVNFDPHGGTSNLTSAGSTDAFLFKLNILQNLAWAERWGSTGPDQVMPGALINYFDESLAVGGQFSGTVDFDPSAGTRNITSNGGGDAFIATFGIDGKLKSALGFGGAGDDAVSKIAIDLLGESIYATGWFQGKADFDPDPSATNYLEANSASSDIFIAKYDTLGLAWAHNFGSAETDPAKTQMGSGIALNEYDNPVITGRFTGTANFATNGDSYTLTSNGGFDSFIALYDQDGYLWMDQNPNNVTIISPNGGETWDAGSTHDITWQANFTDNVKIEYTTDGGVNWIEVNPSIAASAGKLSWTVPNTPTTQAKIMITELSNEDIIDESDNPFTIKSNAPNPHVTVAYPNGGEIFHRSQNEIIRWTSNDVANVKLEYSLDNGTNWVTIIEATPAAAGAYQWNVPDIGMDQTTQALVRISDQTNSQVFDVSNEPFTIINTTGVNDLVNDNNFINLQVNPDPATVNATITFNTSRAGNVSLDLISTSGATVKSISQGMMADGSHRIELSVNGLESGVYFLRLVSGGDVVVRKMVIVK